MLTFISAALLSGVVVVTVASQQQHFCSKSELSSPFIGCFPHIEACVDCFTLLPSSSSSFLCFVYTFRRLSSGVAVYIIKLYKFTLVTFASVIPRATALPLYMLPMVTTASYGQAIRHLSQTPNSCFADGSPLASEFLTRRKKRLP